MKTLRVTLGVLLCASPLSALASSTGRVGLTSSGCNQCHSGGSAPMTTLSLSKLQVQPGETITATVTVTTPNGTSGGFNLDPSAGTLSNPGPGVKILSGEATHTTPKLQNGSGNLVFTVDWTAPMSGSSASFTAWGNSTNGNGQDSGDRGASATASVQICGTTFFLDQDGDGVGGSMTQQDCAPPTGFVAMGGDCDDANPNVKPGAVESCNMLDDDCDTSVDEGAGSTWYVDADGDGFGDSANALTECTQPSGYVTDGTDCDDGRAAVNPMGTETCDGVDEDCDALVDDGLTCMNPGPDAGAGQDAGMGSGGNDGGSTGADGGTSPSGEEEAGGCGCTTVPASSLAALALILLIAAGRGRRRRE